MVVSRSQANRNNLPEPEAMSENESELSVPDILSRTQMTEFDEDDLLNRNNDVEHNNIERRFSYMSRQIYQTFYFLLLKDYLLIPLKGTA